MFTNLAFAKWSTLLQPVAIPATIHPTATTLVSTWCTIRPIEQLFTSAKCQIPFSSWPTSG